MTLIYLGFTSPFLQEDLGSFFSLRVRSERKNGIVIGNKRAKTDWCQWSIHSQVSGICNLEVTNGKLTILLTLLNDLGTFFLR